MVGTCYMIYCRTIGCLGWLRGPCSGVPWGFVGDVDEVVSVNGFVEIIP